MTNNINLTNVVKSQFYENREAYLGRLKKLSQAERKVVLVALKTLNKEDPQAPAQLIACSYLLRTTEAPARKERCCVVSLVLGILNRLHRRISSSQLADAIETLKQSQEAPQNLNDVTLENINEALKSKRNELGGKYNNLGDTKKDETAPKILVSWVGEIGKPLFHANAVKDSRSQLIALKDKLEAIVIQLDNPSAEAQQFPESLEKLLNGIRKLHADLETILEQRDSLVPPNSDEPQNEAKPLLYTKEQQNERKKFLKMIKQTAKGASTVQTWEPSDVFQNTDGCFVNTPLKVPTDLKTKVSTDVFLRKVDNKIIGPFVSHYEQVAQKMVTGFEANVSTEVRNIKRSILPHYEWINREQERYDQTINSQARIQERGTLETRINTATDECDALSWIKDALLLVQNAHNKKQVVTDLSKQKNPYIADIEAVSEKESDEEIDQYLTERLSYYTTQLQQKQAELNKLKQELSELNQ